jgi:hypothetical protein
MSKKGSYLGGHSVIRDETFFQKVAHRIRRTKHVKQMQEARKLRFAAEMESYRRTKPQLIKRKGP